MNSDRLALTARAYKAAQALGLGVCVVFDKACEDWFGLSVVVVVDSWLMISGGGVVSGELAGLRCEGSRIREATAACLADHVTVLERTCAHKPVSGHLSETMLNHMLAL